MNAIIGGQSKKQKFFPCIRWIDMFGVDPLFKGDNFSHFPCFNSLIHIKYPVSQPQFFGGFKGSKKL